MESDVVPLDFPFSHHLYWVGLKENSPNSNKIMKINIYWKSSYGTLPQIKKLSDTSFYKLYIYTTLCSIAVLSGTFCDDCKRLEKKKECQVYPGVAQPIIYLIRSLVGEVVGSNSKVKVREGPHLRHLARLYCLCSSSAHSRWDPYWGNTFNPSWAMLIYTSL